MANETLNLQEKMVRIREKIPPLVKQAYSEEVNYDFIKIDDIFRYLTPAMNEYGVNFDIVSETATKKDERGNPMFVEFIPMYQMWIYEADLTMKWTNAENPEDVFQITAHAIGFHQMPEKAKGSGWTYCLKYYLLNKFCINQGGDDPDMRNVAPPAYETVEETGGCAEDNWTYGEESVFPQEHDAEPETYQTPELQEGISESAGSVQDEPAVLHEAAMFQNSGEELPEEYPFEGSENHTMCHSVIGPENGTMVTLPESAKETLDLADNDPDNGNSDCQNDRTVQENGRNIQQSGKQNPAPTVNSVPTSNPTSAANLTSNISFPAENQCDMTVEEACNVICNCGLYRGKTLGEIAKSGPDGIQNLKWFVNGYRGRNEELRKGARILLEAAKTA